MIVFHFNRRFINCAVVLACYVTKSCTFCTLRYGGFNVYRYCVAVSSHKSVLQYRTECISMSNARAADVQQTFHTSSPLLRDLKQVPATLSSWHYPLIFDYSRPCFKLDYPRNVSFVRLQSI